MLSNKKLPQEVLHIFLMSNNLLFRHTQLYVIFIVYCMDLSCYSKITVLVVIVLPLPAH